MQERWRAVPPSPLQARPPPQKGWKYETSPLHAVAIARGCCSVGDACRSLRSLCRFPPPSLLPLPRYARAPPPKGILYVLWALCVPPLRHRLRRSLRIGTHEKRLGPFLCGVGCALRRALSEHRIERNGVPRPISIFYPITASL